MGVKSPSVKVLEVISECFVGTKDEKSATPNKCVLFLEEALGNTAIIWAILIKFCVFLFEQTQIQFTQCVCTHTHAT